MILIPAGAGILCTQRKQRRNTMKYEKPEVVAKSESKESFVAGCPTHDVPCGCGVVKESCQTVGNH